MRPRRAAPRRPQVLVVAGVNGAGKSSLLTPALEAAAGGATVFNPDALARVLMQAGMDRADANAKAWSRGLQLLRGAVEAGRSYALETTLGGRTITAELITAARTHDVLVWYCGLDSVQLHVDRVAERAARGGHPIAEHLIRARWHDSRANLIRLLPVLDGLKLFDNSATSAPGQAIAPPRLLLHLDGGRIVAPTTPQQLSAIPVWARPIVEAALSRRATRG